MSHISPLVLKMTNGCVPRDFAADNTHTIRTKADV